MFPLNLLTNWRIILLGSAVAGGVALFAYGRHEHSRAERAQAVAESATRQANLNAATTETVDRYHEQTIVIKEQERKATDAVRTANGSDTPVPPDVLDAWRTGLDGLRNSASGPGDQPAGKPTG